VHLRAGGVAVHLQF